MFTALIELLQETNQNPDATSAATPVLFTHRRGAEPLAETRLRAFVAHQTVD
jgi:hypothetical protein